MNEFTRKNLKEVRERIDEQLAELGEELGVEIKCGSANFSASNVTFKVELAIIDEDGSVQNRTATDFVANAQLYGMKPEDLGATITINRRPMTIVGLKPRNRKYPVLVKDAMGKTYKISAHQAIDALISVWE